MATPAKLGLRGTKLIQKWEGLYLKAYKDSVGIWTIGWGSITNPEFGIKVTPGLVIDRATAQRWFDIEIAEKTAAVLRLVKVPLTQYQLDTLISFSYNVGWGALQKSTLLKLLNQGNYDAVPAQLMRYVNGGGRRIQGLVNRRRDECKLWRNEHIDEIPDTEIVKVPAASITPTKPPVSKAIKSVIESKTAKGAGTQVVVAAGGLFQALSNPWVIGGFVVVAAVSAYILYRKYHDIREMR